MELSEDDLNKILDRIIKNDDDVFGSDEKVDELLRQLNRKRKCAGSGAADGSGADSADGGGGGAAAGGEEEEDTSGQQQQTYYETLTEAFKAAIQELAEIKKFSFFVDKDKIEAGAEEKHSDFLARLKGVSVGVYFAIEKKTSKEKLGLHWNELQEDTREGLKRKIRKTFGVGSLVDIITDKCGEEDPRKYIQGLVKTRSKEEANIRAIPQEPSKAAALVVSGESGSGKSAFVKNEFSGVENCAYIYHSIEDGDLKLIVNSLPPSATSSKIHWKIADVLKLLLENGHTGGDLCDYFSKLHYEVMVKRNEAAVDLLETIIKNKIGDDARLKAWWNGGGPGVDKLVLVIDEAGRNLQFARGLVDSVRKIHRDWQQKKRCTHFKLVLAGSGLEGTIKGDSLQVEDEDLRNDLSSFGTDPMKSNVVTLEGPLKENLQKKLETLISQDCSFKQGTAEAIATGVYSRVLATNSRMLFDGCLPMLKNKDLTFGFDGDRATQLQQRLIELCSTNVVMDFAVRKYIDMNGLKRLEAPKRRVLIEKSFRFLLEASSDVANAENKFAFDDADNLEISTSRNDKLELMQLGVVASSPLKTSPALRYLACEGQSLELIQSDRRSFEALVAAHLRRFEHVVRGFTIVQTHDLNEAWPPKMSKTCETSDEVKAHSRERFAAHVYTDVSAICEQLLKEKKKLAIVMQQRVPSAQSADVIVLESDWSESGVALTVDLYQAKHYQKYSGQKIREWVRSLGISMPPNSASSPNPSAQYSDLGIEFLMSCLKTHLLNSGIRIETTIRNRVLVVSGTRVQTTWDARVFEAAHESGVKIWTRENLEPTFSAITCGDAGVLAGGVSAGMVGDGQMSFVDGFAPFKHIASLTDHLSSSAPA